jgi:hypothetical protein
VGLAAGGLGIAGGIAKKLLRGGKKLGGGMGRSAGKFKPNFKKRWGMGGSKNKSQFFSKKAAKKRKLGTAGKIGLGAGVGAGIGAGAGVSGGFGDVMAPMLFGGLTVWALPILDNWRCKAMNVEGE